MLGGAPGRRSCAVWTGRVYAVELPSNFNVVRVFPLEERETFSTGSLVFPTQMNPLLFHHLSALVEE